MVKQHALYFDEDKKYSAHYGSKVKPSPIYTDCCFCLLGHQGSTCVNAVANHKVL